MNDALLVLYVKTDCALKRLVDRFHNDRRGAGTAEYVMIIGLAVVLGIVVLTKFWGTPQNDDGTGGTGLAGIFGNIISQLTTAVHK